MVRLSWVRSMGKFHPRSVQAEVNPSVPNLAIQVLATFGLMGAGVYLNQQNFNRHTRFRDSSALYGGINPDPENNPSWGVKDYKWKFTVA